MGHSCGSGFCEVLNNGGMKDTIIHGDALTVLRTLPDESVNCCVTSPPYYGLRNYGVDGQIGHEETPELYVLKLVEVFEQVRRVLRTDGTLWLNLGDSYAGSWGAMSHDAKGKAKYMGFNSRPAQSRLTGDLKHKDLIGIPWMTAFALRSAGWYLRQDIIWSKPNCMPESVTDRCTKSHEYIFMLSKSRKYYYDAESIKTEAKESSVQRVSQDTDNQVGGIVPGKTNGNMKAVLSDKQRGHSRRHNGFNDRWDQMTVKEQQSMKANKRSVWTVPPAQFSDAHFATFPPELIVDCIKAGCPVGGLVLDPFMGSGTTAEVSAKLGRHFTGVELNEAYIQIANKRLAESLGFFNPLVA